MSSGLNQGTKELYEFGHFRVDPEKETVLRAGEAIALTPKTFQILLVLIRNSREVITKDELMKAVWPDTFVEESNLTRSISMLRKALGETAQNRYIVTVPGRGYRFAEGVRMIPEQELTLVAASHSKLRVELKGSKSWVWIAAGIVILLAGGASVARYVVLRHKVLSASDTVVLADFTNSTGDTVFDGTLRQGLSIQLEQSPFLSLISGQRISRTLSLMGQAPDAPLTGEIAREVCERTGASAVVEGSIAMLGSQYVLGLRAKNCRTGRMLDEEQAQVAREEDVLKALSVISVRFRRRVGESLATVERYSTPLAEATTSSLEALKAYSAGWQVHAVRGASASLPLFLRATELDPQFAMAHASLGRIYADLDQSDLAAASIEKSWQLRARASEAEKFFLTANYQSLVTGNLEAAQQTCEAWAQAYPREPLPHAMLAGMIHKTPGRFEMALAEAKKAVELDPDFAISYYSVGVNDVFLGHLDEAQSALGAAAARGLDIDEFIMLAFDIDFLKGDRQSMEREIARARVRPGGENWMSAREAVVAAYAGRLERARDISRRAVVQAQQAGQPERAALWEAGAAVREALLGNKKAATERAVSALKLSHDREVEYGAAFAFANSGVPSRAKDLVDDLQKRFPEDSSVRFSYVPTLQAQLALDRGEPGKALESLQVATPHELGVPRSSISGLFGSLYPIYVRGQVYLTTHRGPEAAAEFQKILDHRTIVISDPIGALAHLQLGRALALAGDKPRAKAAYEDFFILWKDADRDLPVLRQARSEYARFE